MPSWFRCRRNVGQGDGHPQCVTSHRYGAARLQSSRRHVNRDGITLRSWPSLVNWRRGVEQSWLVAFGPKDLAQPRAHAERVAPWASAPHRRYGDLPRGRLIRHLDALLSALKRLSLPTRRSQSPDADVHEETWASPPRWTRCALMSGGGCEAGSPYVHAFHVKHLERAT